MGKTKREDGVPRKFTFPIRLADDEYQQIKEKARQARISISDLFRQAALNKQIRVYKPPPPANRDVYRELSAIGVNLNQFIRAINTANKAGTLVGVDAIAAIDAAKTAIEVIEKAQLNILGAGNHEDLGKLS